MWRKSSHAAFSFFSSAAEFRPGFSPCATHFAPTHGRREAKSAIVCYKVNNFFHIRKHKRAKKRTLFARLRLFHSFFRPSLCRQRTIAPGTRLSARKTPQLLPKKPTTFRRKPCSFRQNKWTFYSYLPSPLFVSCICANFEATSPISCAHENRTRLRFSPPTRRGDALHARRICGTPQPNHRSPLRATLGALR